MPVTSRTLFELGYEWFCGVVVSRDDIEAIKKKKVEIGEKLLSMTGQKVYTVWQFHDPFISKKGGGMPYHKIAKDLESTSNKGKDVAKMFVDWIDNKIDFFKMPLVLQHLAVITHVAEVGRGYTRSVQMIYNFAVEIANGKATWNQVKKKYPPSLTSKEDFDYEPDSSEESDDDMDFEYTESKMKE